MKPISVVLLLFACVVAGFSGAILYNYFSLNTAQAQLAQLEANAALHDKLINETYQQERSDVERRQVNPSKLVSLDPSDLTEKRRYLALIVAQIQRNWFVVDSMRGKECRVKMTLASDGGLTSVTVLGGDSDLCFSAVTAIKKGSPYPMSSDPDVYDALKDVTTILQPELR